MKTFHESTVENQVYLDLYSYKDVTYYPEPPSGPVYQSATHHGPCKVSFSELKEQEIFLVAVEIDGEVSSVWLPWNRNYPSSVSAYFIQIYSLHAYLDGWKLNIVIAYRAEESCHLAVDAITSDFDDYYHKIVQKILDYAVEDSYQRGLIKKKVEDKNNETDNSEDTTEPE